MRFIFTPCSIYSSKYITKPARGIMMIYLLTFVNNVHFSSTMLFCVINAFHKVLKISSHSAQLLLQSAARRSLTSA